MVLVYENLRRLFRRDCLLNVVGEDLPKRQVRSDVHVSRRDETVLEIVNAFDVEARPALIGILRRCFWSKDAILDGVEPGDEIRTRVGARAEVAAEAEASLRVDVAAEREVGGAAERLIVSSRKTSALCT